MASDDGLVVETIEGITVYRIDEPAYTGAHDEADVVDERAAERRKKSGWWGDQTCNFTNRLSIDDLRSILYMKSSCPNLNSPGVYVYVNKSNGKIYVGSAVSQSILERQQQHLNSASHLNSHVGIFDAALSNNFNASNWDFHAQSMEGFRQQDILAKERELILKHRSTWSQYGYNIQLPGGVQ